ncbi:uncharacterized protein PAC_12263 [Phialocephala subalpina]|uniref:Uncharacterized protein n=1 Tax=Phialocephala subalpina TaxID=576137 RepID=A0A1L7XBI9_9HELO|nr:uncharacterized protein PAC_12263 [Phialocephala subalpina]
MRTTSLKMLREASTKAMECQIYDQWDRFGATRKEWAIATARNIEDCQQIEEAFKNISDLYLIREQYIRKRGLSMTRHGSVSCLNAEEAKEEIGSEAWEWEVSDIDNDAADSRAMGEAVEVMDQLEFACRHIFENMRQFDLV